MCWVHLQGRHSSPKHLCSPKQLQMNPNLPSCPSRSLSYLPIFLGSTDPSNSQPSYATTPIKSLKNAIFM
ncbi:hypothetical protein Hanom_Chr03g00275041 [Helianthus anomalus]